MKTQEPAQPLSQSDLDEAKDLDRRLTDAFGQRDLDAVMGCFWNDPELVVVLNGNVFRGPEATRAALGAMLEQNQSIRVEVNEISHVQAGDSVLGVGTATFDMNPVDGPPRLLVERWSDLRRKIDGQWVFVLDHTTHLEE